jgi:ATP-binding protein involved in chromosome partitioning
MRIAIPVAAGNLAPHFGHCEEFALIDCDPDAGRIIGMERVAAPPHQPGLLPRWLAEQGATVIIAGGMGGRAQQLFDQSGIRVVIGAPSEPPRAVAEAFLANSLRTGPNVCDH